MVIRQFVNVGAPYFTRASHPVSGLPYRVPSCTVLPCIRVTLSPLLSLSLSLSLILSLSPSLSLSLSLFLSRCRGPAEVRVGFFPLGETTKRFHSCCCAPSARLGIAFHSDRPFRMQHWRDWAGKRLDVIKSRDDVTSAVSDWLLLCLSAWSGRDAFVAGLS